MLSSLPTVTIHRFGLFRLDVDARILFLGSEPILLGQRTIALLRLLLERQGTPVSKDALIEAAWPGLTIEASNLTVQIAALRRVFKERAGGASWIETLPRRGYRYVGPAVATDRAPAETKVPTSPALLLPDRPSIAVLPFSDLRGDPEQGCFADGLVEDIIAGLSHIKWLFVVGRNSSFAYKRTPVDVTRVGRELGVRYLLQGSLRKNGAWVRISVQMIDAETGGHVWVERYDRPLDDIFALQDEITLSVVGAIEPSLRRAEIDRIKRIRPDSLNAYDLVLKAQPDVDSGIPGRVAKALPLLEHALALDPTYAPAHAFAAMCHHCIFLRGGLREENRAASIRHAEAAIVHGSDDAFALSFAGFSLGMDAHDRAAAFAAFEAALTVSPSSARTYIYGSLILGFAGEAERAIEWGERGMRLSPFDAWSFSAFHAFTLGHFYRGRYEAAADAAHKAVQSNPALSFSYMLLAAALSKLGQRKEAKSAAARVLELQPAVRYSRHFAGVDCAPALTAALSEALRGTGMPE